MCASVCVCVCLCVCVCVCVHPHPCACMSVGACFCVCHVGEKWRKENEKGMEEGPSAQRLYSNSIWQFRKQDNYYGIRRSMVQVY